MPVNKGEGRTGASHHTLLLKKKEKKTSLRIGTYGVFGLAPGECEDLV